jgi:son of sevenless
LFSASVAPSFSFTSHFMATVTASSYRSNSTFVASSSSTTSTSLQSSNLSAFDSVAQQDSEFDDDAYPLFCRALYDYTAQDTSALSFRKGEIIEILSQQPSGWWDGLLGDERGWFPSNYVTIISDEEAELTFSGSDFSNADVHVQQIPSTSSQSRQSVVDMSEALMRGGSQEDSEQWLQSLGGDTRGGLDELANATLDNASAPLSEYWMPRVAPSGQVSYSCR